MDTAKFNRLKREIGEDLGRMITAIGEPAASANRVYVDRQIDKYLKPRRRDVFDPVKRDLEVLRDLFTDKGDRLPTWSYQGLQWGPSVKFFFAFGYSPINGAKGGEIRIEPKCNVLTDKIAAGVMLHEATHFALGTVDHKYDNFAYPGHDRLKELPADKCYENADNWRIFYQKMRSHFRP